jgi:hypothetical protein
MIFGLLSLTDLFQNDALQFHSFILQAGLEPAAAAAAAVVAAPKFSQCNVLWRSVPQSRSSGYRKFDSGWCFIST